MFALISRILNLSGRYKSRIQAAFLCAFVESILSKMPIFMAFIVLAGFADNTLTGKTCLFVGLGLLAVVVVQTVVHYLSDRLQSAAGFMIFADGRFLHPRHEGHPGQGQVAALDLRSRGAAGQLEQPPHEGV